MTVRDILLAEPDRYRDAAGAWLPVESIANLLCSPRTVPNPTPRKSVPVTITKTALVDAVGVAAVSELSDIAISEITRAVEMQDRESLKLWADIGLSRGKITLQQYGVLAGALVATQPDPDWREAVEIPPALNRVNESEIQAAIEEIDNAG
jgi:hypothetical protein